jgi:hypothetical protein
VQRALQQTLEKMQRLPERHVAAPYHSTCFMLSPNADSCAKPSSFARPLRITPRRRVAAVVWGPGKTCQSASENVSARETMSSARSKLMTGSNIPQERRSEGRSKARLATRSEGRSFALGLPAPGWRWPSCSGPVCKRLWQQREWGAKERERERYMG